MLNGNRDEHWRARNLIRLDEALHRATSRPQQLLLLCRKAGALARLSLVEDARRLIRGLRQENEGHEPQLAAWIMLAEGLVDHFDSLGAYSVDRFKRAYAIGTAIGDTELAALSAAWLANAALIDGNAGAIAAPLTQAFRLASADQHEALGRASLVVADALSWSGERAQAKPWYRQARHHAIEDGDIAMQSVLLFNEAAFRVAALVMADCRGEQDAQETRFTAMTVESVATLDFGIGLQRLTSMVPLLRAEVCTVEQRWTDALALLEPNVRLAGVHGQARIAPKYLAEMAYCHASLGDTARSIEYLERALRDAVECTDQDDLFVLFSRAAAVTALAGQDSEAQAHRLRAARCLAEFQAFQGGLRTLVQELVDQLPAPAT